MFHQLYTPTPFFPQPYCPNLYYQLPTPVLRGSLLLPQPSPPPQYVTFLHHYSRDGNIPTVISKRRQNQFQRPLRPRNILKPIKNKVHNNLKIGLFNAHSVGTKARRIQIVEFLQDQFIDILFLTETWLKTEGDEAKHAHLCPPGFKIKSLPRETRGGGIAIIYKDYLKIDLKSDFTFNHTSFELVQLTISAPEHLHFFCLYRPPASKKNKTLDSTFPKELPELFDHINNLKGKVVVLGDFNVQFNNTGHWLTKKVLDITTMYDFEQGVKDTTFSRSGNIIDWVLYREVDDIMLKCVISEMLTSDHNAVVCTLNISRPSKEATYKLVRDVTNIDIKNFKSDVKKIVSDLGSDITAQQLDDHLREALDEHAPEVKKCIFQRRSSIWFPFVREELKLAKRMRRRAERRYRKTKLTVDKQLFDKEIKNVVMISERGEELYWKSKINPDINSKDLYFHTNKLLGRSMEKISPSNIKTSEIPETFSMYFQDKVKNLRNSFSSINDDNACFDPLSNDEQCFSSTFNNFKTVNELEIRKLIMNSNSKTCRLDPIPTSLIKICIDELLPAITIIINRSLQTAVFPENYKQAIVTPLIKKPSLDKNVLKNYRPVSNLPFISKILEKVVLSQLKDYLNENNLFPINQSAYREGHSTETTLLKMMNDLLLDVDQDRISILALLDLSAAFDTVDYTILLDRLEYSYGIKSKVLNWISSYLTGRTQTVSLNGVLSEPMQNFWGVPQGSVLGPLLFVLYTKPIHSISLQNDSSCHSFADDTQLKKSCDPDQIQTSLIEMQNCIANVKTWMSNNKLKLNDEKTEFLLICSSYMCNDISFPNYISIGGTNINFSHQARNLGVTISSTLSLESHISNICRSSFCELRRISNIRQYLDIHSTKILMCSLILSKIDYCNALYYGIPQKLIEKLEKIQNTAAKIIFKAKKSDHVTPLLMKLHWLPVSARIEYKIALLVFKFFTDTHFPLYLSELFEIYKPKRTLRSSNDSRLLVKKKVRKKTYGNKSLTYAAPSIWNTLPFHVRHSKSISIFKKNLKTYLFKKSFTV